MAQPSIGTNYDGIPIGLTVGQERRQGSVCELTLRYPLADAESGNGTHDGARVGHLLIRAGHRPNGLMRAPLGKKELDALKRRHLKFNEAEQATILRKLRLR